MKRVFSSESLVDAGHVRAVLEQHGIACFLKNEQLSGALGEVPFLECMPEVWVRDDADAARAESLVGELSADAPAGVSWTCAHCNETNEPQYVECWNCGARDVAD